MKNWSREHNQEIRTWFDIDNYRALENCTLYALYYELWARALLYKPGPSDEEKKGLWQYMVKIFDGRPLLFDETSLDFEADYDCLYNPPHVFLTDITRLAQLGVSALSAELFTWDGGDVYGVNLPHHQAYVSEVMAPLCENTVMLEIDLASGTDDEITASIKSVLPQWRKIKNVTTDQSGVVRFGYGTIKKIISYRLVAMLDILLWAKRHEVRISDDRLSRLLYTDDDDESVVRQQNHIKDSDRPLAMKAATIDFIKQFNLFINRNSHIKNMRVSDVMKLAELG